MRKREKEETQMKINSEASCSNSPLLSVEQQKIVVIYNWRSKKNEQASARKRKRDKKTKEVILLLLSVDPIRSVANANEEESWNYRRFRDAKQGHIKFDSHRWESALDFVEIIFPFSKSTRKKRLESTMICNIGECSRTSHVTNEGSSSWRK